MEKTVLKIENLLTREFFTSLIVILLSILIYNAISYLFEKGEEKLDLKIFTGKRSQTYLKLTRSIIRSIFVLVTILIVLDIYGVDVNSALTGVGIFGVILGFALQDWFKDIVRGGNIISDNYFSVGDIIKYHDSIAKVLVIGLKSTRVQDLDNDNIITIANRNIEEVEIISHVLLVNVPMSYELPLSKAEETINHIIDAIKKIEHVEDCIYTGVYNLNDSSISYRLKISVDPLYRLKTRKIILRTILDVMEKDGIQVPYNQLDIHNK